MASAISDDLKHAEQRTREAHWDPVQRWLVLQETITWAEAQPTAKRNTPQKCLELQNARLAQNDPQTGLARSRPEHDT